MKNGMSKKVYREVYAEREETFIVQPTYNDILLLEANKTAERKRKLRTSKTVTIKIKRKQ